MSRFLFSIAAFLWNSRFFPDGGNIISNNLDCIAHLHAAGHPGRHELQNGENNYHFIFAAVDKAGYSGACGLEYMPLMPPEESLTKAKRLYGTVAE